MTKSLTKITRKVSNNKLSNNKLSNNKLSNNKKENLIQLQPIRLTDFTDIKKLTQTKSVMQHISDGNIWSNDKVMRFIKYSLEDERIPDRKRENYYYRITYNNELGGIIGFHKFPMLRNHNFYLTIYLSPNYQGKGIFSESLRLLKNKVKRHQPRIRFLVSLTHQSNTKMNEISQSKFTYDREIRLKQIKVNQYLLFLDIPNKFNSFKKKFYLVKSNYLKSDMVRQVFCHITNCYWEEYNMKYPQVLNPNLLYVDGTFIQHPQFRKFRPEIKSMIDDGKYQIAHKDNLFSNMMKKKTNQKFMLAQENLTLSQVSQPQIKKLFQPGKVWIFKPVDGFAGKGILIADQHSQIEEHIKQYQDSNSKKYQNWILQEYITNPLLLKNKKFHMRVYFLYTYLNQKAEGYLLDIAKIFTAKNKFVLEDYLNLDIHDTHLSSTPQPIYYERDFTKEYGEKMTQKINKQMKTMFKSVLQCLNAKCYSESKDCYELFGADVMITDTFQIKLIEVNTKIGMGTYPNDPVDINKIIFENLMDVVVGVKEKERFILL